MPVVTNGLHSDGTILTYKIGAAAAVPLGEVMDIDPGTIKRTTVPKKRITPANHIKKKMKGLLDIDSWKIQLGFKTAQEADLYDLTIAGTEALWSLEFPDGSKFQIPAGWIESYSPPKVKEDDELQSEIVVQNDGSLPTWVEAT